MVHEMPMLGLRMPSLRNGHIPKRKTVLMCRDRIEEWERRPLRTTKLRTIGISEISRVTVEPGRFRHDLIIECAAREPIVARGLSKGPAQEAQRRLAWLVSQFPETDTL